MSWYSIQEIHGFGALQIGQWTAWPSAGRPDADPYTKANVATKGQIPLGAAEGIAFHAITDSGGAELRLNCQYLIEGQTPPARFWTLTTQLTKNIRIASIKRNTTKLLSRNILRKPNGSFEIRTGPNPAPGNWLKTSGSSPYQLIFRLYDSPVTSTGGVVDSKMPSITRLECNS